MDEIDLHKKIKNLEAEVDRLQESNQLKDLFLANLSHELRTPLNGIIGFSELMQLDLEAYDLPRQSDYAKNINQGANRLLILLNNIIHYKQIESDDLSLSPEIFNLNQLVIQVTDEFREKADHKKLSLKIIEETAYPVLADKYFVKKVLSDLLDNAIKYTKSGGITIKVSFDKDRNYSYYEVEDSGIGIDTEYLPIIFLAYNQESYGMTRSFQGAGLSLPLAKKLVDLMGGKIIIESQKGMGTKVKVFHPISQQQIGILPDKVNCQQIHQRGLKILVVEDDPLNKQLIEEFLQECTDLTAIEDGIQALEVISEMEALQQNFDGVIMDINLPKPYNGIELMHLIRKKYPAYQQIPFLAHTAYALNREKKKLLEQGFDQYLAKPVNKEKLLEIIQLMMHDIPVKKMDQNNAIESYKMRKETQANIV